MDLIDKLQWRYATKTFDPSKKVQDQDIEFLKEAIKLFVSSYRLQLYKILINQTPFFHSFQLKQKYSDCKFYSYFE